MKVPGYQDNEWVAKQLLLADGQEAEVGQYRSRIPPLPPCALGAYRKTDLECPTHKSWLSGVSIHTFVNDTHSLVIRMGTMMFVNIYKEVSITTEPNIEPEQ